MDLQQNTNIITAEEFFSRVENGLHQFKNYYSLYITPNGNLIDCGYPSCIGHNDVSKYVYENLATLPNPPFNSNLGNENISFNNVPIQLETKFNLFYIYITLI